MTEQIRKIKHYLSRVTTSLNELEHLEKEQLDDYDDVLFEMRWITNVLENREQLMKK